MAGPFQQFGAQLPFSQPGVPPNPALYRPAPPTDQSQTTASILSALARSLFNPVGAGADAAGAIPTPQPIAPTPVGPASGPSGLLPGEMRIPPSILNPPGGVSTPMPSGSPPPVGPSSGGPMGAPLPPPMLRPGSDTGSPAPDGGDTGGVLQTALGVAQGAQNDPDITKSVINDLMTMGGDPEQNKWLALAKAGFAMAASRNPSILGAAGEGAEAGLSDYLKSRQETLQNRYTAAQLQQAAQDHAASIAASQASQALAQKEFDLKLDEYKQTLPADLALKAAQADYYASHGNYFDARAAMPGGSGGSGAGNTALMHWNTNVGNLSKQYLAALPVGQMNDPANIDKAYAWALSKAGPRPGGNAAEVAVTQPAPAAGAGAMPAGAVQAAPAGAVDGQTGGGGKFVVRGGFYYPVGQ